MVDSFYLAQRRIVAGIRNGHWHFGFHKRGEFLTIWAAFIWLKLLCPLSVISRNISYCWYEEFTCIVFCGARTHLVPAAPICWHFSTTPRHVRSAGLLWLSDQLVTEAATFKNTRTTQEMIVPATNGVRTCDSNNQLAADLRLIPHCHRDQLYTYTVAKFVFDPLV
jgi:hypothetical protein